MSHIPLSSPMRRKILKAILLGGAALACHTPARLLAALPPVAHSQTKLLMGTFVTITAVDSSKTQAEEALGRSFETIEQLESTFSRYAHSSPLHVLNTQGTLADAPPHLLYVIKRAQRFHALTKGAFDPTIAPVVDMFRAHSNPQGRMQLNPDALENMRHLLDMNSLVTTSDSLRLTHQNMALTLDGIAKGYIADCASSVLHAHGIPNHLVNAGGDIRASGHKAPGQPWQIAIAHPADKKRTLTTLPLTNAIATSGSYEVFYDAARKHHHLINPMTRTSPQHTISVSVTAPTTLEADALATALAVMPSGDALRFVKSLPGYECCLLTRQGAILTSDGWGKG